MDDRCQSLGDILMSLLHIYTYKSKYLRRKSLPVDKISDDIKSLVDDMTETLRSKPGLGLAAPQIGKNIRIIVIESRGVKDEEGNVVYEHFPLKILINPEIVSSSKEKIEMEEGCFSVPNLFGPVIRPKKIKVIARDIKGKNIKLNTGGLLSRVIQHEIDHLDGIVFTDLINDKKKIRKLDIESEIQG